MMREERREPLTYKRFFIQTYPMGHIVFGGGEGGRGQLFTQKMIFLGSNGI